MDGSPNPLLCFVSTGANPVRQRAEVWVTAPEL
jgi:hypothetical protein